jgi:hypothetical protein
MKEKRYKPTTHLVHGPPHSAKWDFSHHVTPPLSSSTTYRLVSAKRGARGFSEFGQYVKDQGETPASMTHSSYAEEHAPTAEHRSAIRLSIGLESPRDIIRDLDDALAAVAKRGATAP